MSALTTLDPSNTRKVQEDGLPYQIDVLPYLCRSLESVFVLVQLKFIITSFTASCLEAFDRFVSCRGL